MKCRRECIKGYSLNLRRRWAGFPGDEGPVPNLKQVRIGAGLTMREMASRIGISYKFYYELEKRRKNASRRTLASIVRVVTELRARASEGCYGRFGRLLIAVAEAERRGHSTASEIAEMGMFRDAVAVGPLLRWARVYGLVERYASTQPSIWLLTDEGRRRAMGVL